MANGSLPIIVSRSSGRALLLYFGSFKLDGSCLLDSITCRILCCLGPASLYSPYLFSTHIQPSGFTSWQPPLYHPSQNHTLSSSPTLPSFYPILCRLLSKSLGERGLGKRLICLAIYLQRSSIELLLEFLEVRDVFTWYIFVVTVISTYQKKNIIC